MLSVVWSDRTIPIHFFGMVTKLIVIRPGIVRFFQRGSGSWNRWDLATPPILHGSIRRL